MPSDIPFHEFKRYFKKYDVAVVRGKKHYLLRRVVNGVVHAYPFPVHKNKVPHVYLKGARKKLKLTPKEGVSNDEFLG